MAYSFLGCGNKVPQTGPQPAAPSAHSSKMAPHPRTGLWRWRGRERTYRSWGEGEPARRRERRSALLAPGCRRPPVFSLGGPSGPFCWRAWREAEQRGPTKHQAERGLGRWGGTPSMQVTWVPPVGSWGIGRPLPPGCLSRPLGYPSALSPASVAGRRTVCSRRLASPWVWLSPRGRCSRDGLMPERWWQEQGVARVLTGDAAAPATCGCHVFWPSAMGIWWARAVWRCRGRTARPPSPAAPPSCLLGVLLCFCS